MFKKIHLGSSLLLGSTLDLTQEEQQSILNAVLKLNKSSAEQDSNRSILSGRGRVVDLYLSSLNKTAILKSYRRGGLLSKLGLTFFFAIGKSRGELEFEVLENLLSAKVAVPRPIAFITEGHIFRRDWIITGEIKNSQTLIDALKQSEERAISLCKKAALEVVKLIQIQIWHVDLHPGNILIDDQDNTFLIDFDKAKIFKGNLNKLRDAYICRWRRAIIKYNLPETLIETFVSLVRRDYGSKNYV